MLHNWQMQSGRGQPVSTCSWFGQHTIPSLGSADKSSGDHFQTGVWGLNLELRLELRTKQGFEQPSFILRGQSSRQFFRAQRQEDNFLSVLYLHTCPTRAGFDSQSSELVQRLLCIWLDQFHWYTGIRQIGCLLMLIKLNIVMDMWHNKVAREVSGLYFVWLGSI